MVGLAGEQIHMSPLVQEVQCKDVGEYKQLWGAVAEAQSKGRTLCVDKRGQITTVNNLWAKLIQKGAQWFGFEDTTDSHLVNAQMLRLLELGHENNFLSDSSVIRMIGGVKDKLGLMAGAALDPHKVVEETIGKITGTVDLDELFQPDETGATGLEREIISELNISVEGRKGEHKIGRQRRKWLENQKLTTANLVRHQMSMHTTAGNEIARGQLDSYFRKAIPRTPDYKAMLFLDARLCFLEAKQAENPTDADKAARKGLERIEAFGEGNPTLDQIKIELGQFKTLPPIRPQPSVVPSKPAEDTEVQRPRITGELKSEVGDLCGRGQFKAAIGKVDSARLAGIVNAEDLAAQYTHIAREIVPGLGKVLGGSKTEDADFTEIGLEKWEIAFAALSKGAAVLGDDLKPAQWNAMIECANRMGKPIEAIKVRQRQIARLEPSAQRLQGQTLFDECFALARGKSP